jgi:hypothetical protein
MLITILTTAAITLHPHHHHPHHTAGSSTAVAWSSRRLTSVRGAKTKASYAPVH